MSTSPTSAKTVARLRVVVFTAGGLSATKRVFLTRLAADPLIDLRGVVVDDYQPRQPRFVQRFVRGLRRHGLPWTGYILRKKVGSLLSRMGLRTYDALHEVRALDPDYRSLPGLSRVEILHTSDIHSRATIDRVRSLEPDLGVIFGGRILKDELIGVPTCGSLNIHKRKVPDYRGGGAIGYWEMLHGEKSIGVTIHFATSAVDAGPVVAETTIPLEPNETLDSIRIKADTIGTNLYLDTLHDFAEQRSAGQIQDEAGAQTYRAAGEYREHVLNAALRGKSAAAFRRLRAQESTLTRARLFLQYAALLPMLIAKRRRLARAHRAPILMLYYHVVANRPVNHLCLSLEDFVAQVEFIRRYYEIISVEEATRRIRSGRNDRVAVVLTFDDGYSENYWAIEYLKLHGIPACFFVSTGHIREQTPFQHDLDIGVQDARPMSERAVRELAREPLSVGSHAVYHEDFGRLDRDTAHRVLAESKQHLAEMMTTPPEHFSFPKGLRGVNITRDTFEAALAEYDCVYSAYGGYNYPLADQKHYVRFSNPYDLLGLMLLMDGYTSLKSVLTGDGWTTKTAHLPPYGAN